MMRRIRRLLIAGTLLAGAASADPPSGEAQRPEWVDAIRQGDVRFAFRYRFEQVDDDLIPESARASTLRSRLSWRSAAWRRWSAQLEIDDVQAIGNDLYNSTRNGETTRPLVADPEGTEINVAALQYSGSRHSVTVGRQRLNLDNQRFVGTSAWRQNEQTFDGLSARYRLSRTDIAYSLFTNINRSFGPKDGTPPADLHGRVHLLNLKQDAGSFGSVTAFAYVVDLDNAAALSSRTLGLRWTGNYPLAGDFRASLAASFARQKDAGDNAAHFTVYYRQLELGIKRGDWSVSVGRETLEGDPVAPDRSFQTPLATLHVFQGWADKFTTTPAAGIEDTYVAFAGSAGNFKAMLGWHDFRAEANDLDYGREWDASVSYLFADRYELLLKAADYSSAGFSTDTTKLWLQLSASF